MEVGAIGMGFEISRVVDGCDAEALPKRPYTAIESGRVADQPLEMREVTDSTLEDHESGTVKTKW